MISLEILKEAFVRWETYHRHSADHFKSHEEVLDMPIQQVAQESAEYFLTLLNEIQKEQNSN